MASFFTHLIVKGSVLNYVFNRYFTYCNVDIHFRITIERCWETT